MRTLHSRKFYEGIKPVLATEYISGSTIKMLAETHKLSEKFVWDTLVELGIPRRAGSKECRKYPLDESFFDEIDHEKKAYILGFIYADGYVSKNESKQRYMLRIALGAKDEALLHEIQECLSCPRPLYYDTKVTKKGFLSYQVTLVISSKNIIEKLEGLGCLSPKALKITFPYFLPKELLPHFIRGYFDGDGHIGRDKTGLPVLHFASNPIFIQQLKDYLTNVLDVVCYSYQQSPRTHVLHLHSWGSVLALGEIMWKNSTLHLDRKYKEFENIKKAYQDNEIKKNSLRYEREFLLQLKSELSTWKQVHRFLGIPESTLHYHLRKAGL
jgi:DNA-binding transcriptional regulator WhiA